MCVCVCVYPPLPPPCLFLLPLPLPSPRFSITRKSEHKASLLLQGALVRLRRVVLVFVPIQHILHKKHRKQSADGQAHRSVVKLSISCAKRAVKFWTYLYLAVRRRSRCTSASNWEPQVCWEVTITYQY